MKKREFPQKDADRLAKKNPTDLQSNGKSKVKKKKNGFVWECPFASDTTSAEDTNLPNKRNE